ncbi:hypothetical protein V6Z11_D03G154500 [Gossypium hirsutum]
MSFVDSPDNVRYEMNDQNRFYLCRHCRNHIVTKNNLIRYVTGTEPGYLCENVVNVGMDPVRTWRYLDDVAVLNVRCNDCHRHIGERFGRVAVLGWEPVASCAHPKWHCLNAISTRKATAAVLLFFFILAF